MDLLVSFHIYHKFKKVLYTNKWTTSLTQNFKYSLLNMIDIWKQHLNKGNLVDVLLIDISKAFNTINHNF